MRELSVALGRLGCRVDLFTGAGGGKSGQVTAVGLNARLIFFPVGLGCEAKPDLYRYMDRFAEDVNLFCRKKQDHYDFIFSNYWLSGQAGRILKELWGVPHLMMFHTLGAAKNDSGSQENEPELRIRVEEDLTRECDRIIAASEREKQALLHYTHISQDKIALIPCGVNLNLFRPTVPGRAYKVTGRATGKIILYVGRVEPVKGLELLLRAVACLPGQGGDFRLLIIGGDEHSAFAVQRYQNLARELGIHEQVTFLGAIEHHKLPLYYSAADVTVIPSFYESFGMTALESLACGTPVAATDVGALSEIIRQGLTGAVIEGRAPERLAEAIFSMITLPLKPVYLCRESTQSYGWPQIARRFEQEFRTFMNR